MLFTKLKPKLCACLDGWARFFVEFYKASVNIYIEKLHGSEYTYQNDTNNSKWTMDTGQWIMGNEYWTLDNGQWIMENGKCTIDNEQWII